MGNKYKQKQKIAGTEFEKTQVPLLYKDLLRTGVVTVIVTIVLLSIFLYVR